MITSNCVCVNSFLIYSFNSGSNRSIFVCVGSLFFEVSGSLFFEVSLENTPVKNPFFYTDYSLFCSFNLLWGSKVCEEFSFEVFIWEYFLSVSAWISYSVRASNVLSDTSESMRYFRLFSSSVSVFLVPIKYYS